MRPSRVRGNDWDAEATAMAVYVGEHLFEAHRGAIPWWQEGITVIFGNDNYAGKDWSKQEVAMVREWLEENKIPILGFGTDPEDDYSWAMLVGTRDVDAMYKLVWACFLPQRPVREVMATDGRFVGVQPGIADRAIAKSRPRPRVELN
jgi:hypothetical protein